MLSKDHYMLRTYTNLIKSAMYNNQQETLSYIIIYMIKNLQRLYVI